MEGVLMQFATMRSNRHAGWFLIALLLLVVLPTLQVSALGAGWQDKLRNFGQKAKEKIGGAGRKAREKVDAARESWKKRERRCDTCGKTIHFGQTCATCKARAVSQKAKQTVDRAKEDWRKREHPCSTCGKMIHIGQTCATCKARAVSQKAKQTVDKVKEDWREREHPCSSCGKMIHVGQVCMTCKAKAVSHGLKEGTAKVKDGWERFKPQLEQSCKRARDWGSRHKELIAKRTTEAMRKYGPKIVSAVRDPENQRKAFEAVGAYMKFKEQLDTAKKDVTYKTLSAALSLPIQTKSGTMSLEAMAKERLLERFPGLSGTDFVEDPAAPLTALLTNDRGYLLRECKFVKTRNGHVSPMDALAQSGSRDTDKLLRCLDFMAATESVSHTLVTGEGSLDAMAKTVKAMKAIDSN